METVLKVDIRDFNNNFFYEFKRQKEDHKGKELSSYTRISARKIMGLAIEMLPHIKWQSLGNSMDKY